MTLISQIGSTITRSTIGISGASKIRCQLYTIILFTLLLSARLNKTFCLDIIDEALLDQAIVIDLDSNTSAFSSSASTYREEEVESILGSVDKNAAVWAI